MEQIIWTIHKINCSAQSLWILNAIKMQQNFATFLKWKSIKLSHNGIAHEVREWKIKRIIEINVDHDIDCWVLYILKCII